MAITGYEGVAQFYDMFDTKENVPFFLSMASNHGAVVDIGAGTGRIAVPLSEAGHDVLCVEPSPDMLLQLRRKLANNPIASRRISVYHCDAASFSPPAPVTFCIMSGVFDHLLDDTARRRTLYAARRALRPGGTLVLDAFTGLMDEHDERPAGAYVNSDHAVHRFIQAHHAGKAILRVTLRYVEETKNRKKEYIVHSDVGITDARHILELVERSGFAIAHVYGDYDYSPYTTGSSKVIIEARAL